MDDVTADGQKHALILLVRHAITIMRGEFPFSSNDPELGSLSFVDQRYKQIGNVYHYQNNTIPAANITITTTDDPLDYTEDREKVKIVPLEFSLGFYIPVRNIDQNIIKNQLNLSGYWVGSEGKRFEGNDIGAGLPPNTQEHRYRYRAENISGSEFPVDVELYYFDNPDNEREVRKPGFWRIDIRRAYPYLTPEMRKQKRDEERESKREKYGYMNLCTGAICPETGIWEGWTKDGPTDVLRVEKGRKFDVVRTVSINQSTAPCPMIEGQWMWLCALQDERGFVWNGMALGG
ncbi:hypothetical protein [Paraburkholderia sp. J41]|uniref:hypothetical protein n=1 Tax=Paraburkholderia sp. J41 TaxID=2805433 RepID=UPI002AC320C3|nr:hypothetical protein [Paraburkholderia sp. J41]